MLGLGLGLALGLGLGFDPSSPIIRELVLSLTRLSFPLVRLRHNHESARAHKTEQSSSRLFSSHQFPRQKQCHNHA